MTLTFQSPNGRPHKYFSKGGSDAMASGQQVGSVRMICGKSPRQKKQREAYIRNACVRITLNFEQHVKTQTHATRMF